MLLYSLAFFLLSTTSQAAGSCPPTGPVFPVPKLTASTPGIPQLAAHLDSVVAALASTAGWETNITSFSLQLSSKTEKLWELSHTAEVLGNYTDSPPLEEVDGDTVFRIASISKVFTVLAILLQKGVGLEDPISKWIPELQEAIEVDSGVEAVDWEQITVRSLASQMSGLVRDYAQGDLADFEPDFELPFDDPISVGFPPVPEDEIPPCNKNSYDRFCNRTEWFKGVKQRPPMFQPNFKSSYSNPLASPTPKSSQNTYLNLWEWVSKPPDKYGAIPHGVNHWRWKNPLANPTGGVYTSANDLSRFGRAILSSELLPQARTNAWLKPTSHTRNTNSAYGMPWEITRSESVAADGHAVDFYTKDGGLAGYYSTLTMVPEYGIVITILVAGDYAALSKLLDALSTVAVQGTENIVRHDIRKRYTGVYSALPSLNSSIEFVVDDGAGIHITSLISNSTDMLPLAMGQYFYNKSNPVDIEIRMTPTGLSREGAEVWRWAAYSTKEKTTLSGVRCMDSLDNYYYAGLSVMEVLVFLGDEGVVEKVGLPALRVELLRVGQEEEESDEVMRERIGLFEEL